MIKKTKNKKTSSKMIANTKKSTANNHALISVLEQLPIGVIVFTLNKILFLNKEALKVFKPTKALQKTITNHSIFEYLLPEYHKRIKENSLRLFKGEVFEPFELKVKNAKNEIIDLEVKSSVIDFNGQKAIQTIFTDISEQVQYREELSEAKQNLELITENANDLIYFYTYHPKPKYIYISPSIKKILGYSAQEFYKNGNLATTMVVDKKAYKIFEDQISKKQKNNTLKHTTASFQYRTKSGKLIWLEDNYSPIYDEKGKIKFILGISRDITKEKIVQIELEQKWNNYKNLLDSSPIGIFIHKGYCIYSNKTAASILEERNPQKLIGTDLIKYIVPEQRKGAIDRMSRAVNGEELPNLIYKIKTTKGKIIDVELKTVPFIYNGEPCAQTIISNVSAEKQLSKEILRAEIAEETNKKLTQEINYRQKIQQELVTQTTKYEAIFNNSSHLIWTINRDLQITSFNPKYFEYVKSIFNHELKTGQHIGEIMKNQKDHVKLDFWINKYTEFFNKKKDNKAEFFEIKNVSPKGKTHYREIFLHPIRSSDGKIIEIAVIGHDNTERRLSEQKIIEQSAKLQAIFESGKQLIWTVDRNYFFTSFNQNFSDAMYEVYKVRPTLEQKIYKPQKTKAGKEYHNWWLKKYDEVFKSANGIEFTTEQLDSSKKKVYRQIFLHPILKNGIVEEVSCISNDVTELKHLENESINQAAKLSSIFESSSHLIWTIDKDFKATSFNKNFSKAFKLYNKTEPLLNVQLHTLLPKRKQLDYKSYWYSLYKKVFHGNSLKLERQQLEPTGELNYKEIYLNPVRNANNEIIEVACLAHDITENKRFEQQIIDQSAKLKAIFESGEHLIWTINKKLELTSYNKNYFNLIKNSISRKKLEENKTISVLDTIQSKEKKAFWIEKYKLVLQGKPHVFVNKSRINNNDIYREIYLYPIFLNGEVVEVSVIAQNITERIENENKILEQSAKLKAIFESGDQLMWTIGKDLKLSSFNQNYANSVYDFYGYYPEIGKSMRSNKTLEYHSIWDEKYELAFQGKQVEFISERTQSNGKKIIRQILLYPIKGANNEVIEISGIGFDITENKINEEKITQSLKEKDILLKEVHHRVKNNMQVISSILNLQSSYVKDTYALNLLKECQNRIKSMAFIHESLYQTKNFESVNFSEYVTTLSKNLVHTYSINTKKIKLILTLDNLFLSLDASIPCGLIINEIISNSLKYAFPDNRDGIIFVTLRVNKNKVKIEVGDNGVGIPENIDVKNTQTLGLQLVDTLIEQLNGTFKLIRKNGTIFSIEFNI
ncbi:MAG: PAS domain S-box protein [Bacteroidetes bacterium]|nr:PAS domain S-box protein [Bacteroidota bacterium]